MKKTIILLIVLSGMSAFSQTQNVGINTDNPERKLHVNGDLRVTSLPDVTGDNAYPKILSVNKNNGDVDHISTSAFMQSDVNNVEVKRNVYISTTPDNAKECSCGDMTFRINSNNTAEFKLNSTATFTTNNITEFELDYGIKRWTSTYYNYFNDTVTFTADNYAQYHILDPDGFDSNDTVRIYTLILPRQNNLYRLTLSRLANSAVNHTFSLICEKFYIQSL
ncbi:hypothetical protein [Chryseobacterium sp. FH1]|uniref:hypothetical protein n=1 Tax=Chryseobacterium sp. FH1 TaxID=1233951 RepID=UPI0004E44BE9|nr:hypothetical protein [Chryseobacterium sp. FH1]KFC19656.1 hypothetical protein IO90_10305 [Chryseobacterium sp. FH1]